MKISNIVSRRNRILLRELVVTDFKLRYQGSVLGYLWSLLKPLMLFAILYVVFVNFLKIGSNIEHFAVYLLLGMVMWTFFVEATTQGMQAVVARGDLIRKISFPKYIIVISGTISALINLMFNLFVVGVFIVLNGVDLHWSLMWLPFNIVILYVMAQAIAFLLASVYVKYRDTSHIWEVLMQGAFYATPILYPIQMLASPLAKDLNDVLVSPNLWAIQLLMLNPVAMVIQDARFNTITTQAITTNQLFDNPLWQLVPYLIILFVSALAVLSFKTQQKYFAENV
jgi:ABC-2 type transport system permease protein